MRRRSFFGLGGLLLATPAIIRTPGLLMPIRPLWPVVEGMPQMLSGGEPPGRAMPAGSIWMDYVSGQLWVSAGGAWKLIA